MKLKEQDVNMFKVLSQSELGKNLVEYARRLSDHLCDARTFGELSEQEFKARLRATKILEEFIVDKIKLSDQPQRVELNQYA